MIKTIFAIILILFGITLIQSIPSWLIGMIAIAVGLTVLGFSMTGFDWMKRGL